MVRLIACLVLSLPLAACGGGGADEDDFGVDRASFTAEVNHPYFPIVPGMIRTYEGTQDGEIRIEEVRTLPEPKVIVGIPCTAEFERVWLGGVVIEETTEWYAQDRQGAVWKFGEKGAEFDGGGLAISEDAWVAGQDGARPWLAFAADPQAGDRYVGYNPDGDDQFEILSTTATVTVPAGAFAECLQVQENIQDPSDTDIILYARGVGRVHETHTGGTTSLVSVGSE